MCNEYWTFLLSCIPWNSAFLFVIRTQKRHITKQHCDYTTTCQVSWTWNCLWYKIMWALLQSKISSRHLFFLWCPWAYWAILFQFNTKNSAVRLRKILKLEIAWSFPNRYHLLQKCFCWCQSAENHFLITRFEAKSEFNLRMVNFGFRESSSLRFHPQTN